MAKIEIGQEFDLLEHMESQVDLVLPRTRESLSMGIFSMRPDPLAKEDLFEDQYLYRPIIVPGHPDFGYPVDEVDAHFKGLKEKLESLDPQAVRRWPHIHNLLGSILVAWVHTTPRATLNDILPPKLEEVRQIEQRLFLNVNLRTGAFTSPNGCVAGLPGIYLLHFSEFKPTNIAPSRYHDMSEDSWEDYYVRTRISDDIVIEYNKAGFPLCLSDSDTLNGQIPAKFTLG